MAGLFSVRVSGSRGRRISLFPAIKKRLREGPVGRIGKKMADQVRFGAGGISDQFRSQATFTSGGGSIPWKRSQRAIRDGGLTLVEFGDYRRAWLGKGAGSVTRINKRRLIVGVDTGRFPQTTVFQAIRPTRISTTRSSFIVAPRRIALSKRSIDRVEKTVLDYVVDGKAA